MAAESLPKDLKGDWIWLREPASGSHDIRVFARKEFILESSVSMAELWISAIPSYHVFLNGEHIGYGPSSATRTRCYADYYDVSPYLEVGTNAIAVVSNDMAIPTYSKYPHPPKMWCQLNVDNHPVLWTSSQWKIIEASCYAFGQPRCHAGLEYTESVNLKEYPVGWKFSGFNDRHWNSAGCLASAADSFPDLTASKIPSFLWFETDALEPWRSGKFREGKEFTFLSYHNSGDFAAGTYAAQTYLHFDREGEIELLISADDPFTLFCNDKMVLCRKKSVADPPRFDMQGVFRVGNELQNVCSVKLEKGWNRLLCVQKCSANPMGFMIVFPTLPKGSMFFMREPSDNALPGWVVSGPLRMPFEFAAPSLMLCATDSNGFLPLYEHINDISGYLNYCEFTPDAMPVSSTDGLMTGDYVIYNLNEIQYGFPVLDLSGSDGDIIDITSGIHLMDGHVRSIGPLGRKTDTIRLAAGINSWMRFEPRGVRYIMISVRKAAGTVAPILRFISCASDSTGESDFVCSDDVYNDIWKQAMSSIRQCASQNIIDNPCGRRCQSLPESYLYSMTLYALFGGYSLPAKALSEFGENQLENGMMQQIAPSGIFSYSPDAALAWILWLNEHWTASGDSVLLEKMIPTLDLLLDYFRKSAVGNHSLLSVNEVGQCSFLNENGDLDERGIFTPLNALYCRALLSASKIYRDAGKPEKSQVCMDQAAKNAEHLRKMAYCPDTGLFADSCVDGVRSENCSCQTNLIALYSGVAKTSFFEEFERVFLKDNAVLLELSNTKFFAFILETLFAFGRQTFGLNLIKEAYQYNKKRESQMLTNPNPHIFPIIAANYIIRELLGVRAAVPGMTQIYFNPACRSVKKAKGRIPNASGKIVVEWELNDNDELDVNLDSNHPLDVLPLLQGSHVSESTFSLGNRVSLLDPESGN